MDPWVLDGKTPCAGAMKLAMLVYDHYCKTAKARNLEKTEALVLLTQVFDIRLGCSPRCRQLNTSVVRIWLISFSSELVVEVVVFATRRCAGECSMRTLLAEVSQNLISLTQVFSLLSKLGIKT
jgi:hypothetical protein